MKAGNQSIGLFFHHREVEVIRELSFAQFLFLSACFLVAVLSSQSIAQELCETGSDSEKIACLSRKIQNVEEANGMIATRIAALVERNDALNKSLDALSGALGLLQTAESQNLRVRRVALESNVPLRCPDGSFVLTALCVLDDSEKGRRALHPDLYREVDDVDHQTMVVHCRGGTNRVILMCAETSRVAH